MASLSQDKLVEAFYTLGKKYPQAKPKMSAQNDKIVLGILNGWQDFYYGTNHEQLLDLDSLDRWNKYYSQAAVIVLKAGKPKAKAKPAAKPAFVVPAVTTVSFDNHKFIKIGIGIAVAAFIGVAASSGKVASYA